MIRSDYPRSLDDKTLCLISRSKFWLFSWPRVYWPALYISTLRCIIPEYANQLCLYIFYVAIILTCYMNKYNFSIPCTPKFLFKNILIIRCGCLGRDGDEGVGFKLWGGSIRWWFVNDNSIIYTYMYICTIPGIQDAFPMPKSFIVKRLSFWS